MVARLGGSWILHDIAPDGRALLSRNDLRLGITGSFPSGERDLSWFDWAQVAGLSPDGERILFTEFGEGAGAKYFDLFGARTALRPSGSERAGPSGSRRTAAGCS